MTPLSSLLADERGEGRCALSAFSGLFRCCFEELLLHTQCGRAVQIRGTQLLIWPRKASGVGEGAERAICNPIVLHLTSSAWLRVLKLSL